MQRLSKFVVLAFVAACGGALTSIDKSELEAYAAQQNACIAAHPAIKADQDACIAAVRKEWCPKFQQQFDAGVCP